MLILSRRKDEVIMIGDDIALMVVEIRGDKVKLGIMAPGEVQVHRKEVYDAIQTEGRRRVIGNAPGVTRSVSRQLVNRDRLKGGLG